MKKHIAIIIARCLMLSGIARAESCINGNGVLVTGKNGTTKFCFSTVAMNWWSAFTWCEKVGGTLMDVNTDCACTAPNCPAATGGSECINLKIVKPGGTGTCESWTRNENVNNTNYAFSICVQTGTPYVNSHYSKTSTFAAICRMN